MWSTGWALPCPGPKAATWWPRPFQRQRPQGHIPSFLVRPGDVISVAGKGKKNARIKEVAEIMEGQGTLEWLEVDRENLVGKVLRIPGRDEIDIPVQEHLIVELYSR
jgi:small subunit ribosomal protein S4